MVSKAHTGQEDDTLCEP